MRARSATGGSGAVAVRGVTGDYERLHRDLLENDVRGAVALRWSDLQKPSAAQPHRCCGHRLAAPPGRLTRLKTPSPRRGEVSPNGGRAWADSPVRWLHRTCRGARGRAGLGEAVMEGVLGAMRDSRDRRTECARRRGSRHICLAAGIPATAVLAVFLAWSALGFFSDIDHLSRAPLSGAFSVTASQPGERVIYYEGHATPGLSELGLVVRGPDGAAVALKPHDLDLRYKVDSRVGTAVASFVAPVAGRYLVSARVAEPGGRLAVGGDLSTGMLLTDLAGMGVGFGALATIAAIVALVLRRRRASGAEYRSAVTPAEIPSRATVGVALASTNQ